MEINCEHVWREVSNYLDGDIDPGLRAAIEEHVRGCTRCSAVLDGTRNVVQLIGDERLFELPVGFEQRLKRRLEEAMPPPAPAPTKRFFAWIAVAAALILGIFVVGDTPAFRTPQLRSVHSQPGVAVPAGLMVVVAANGKTFHVAGCRFLHDKINLRTIPATEAAQEGYAPCVRCMKEYLSAGLEPLEVAAAEKNISQNKQ